MLVESPLRLLTTAAPLNHEGENAWKEKRVPPSIMELFGGKLSTLVGWIDDVKKSQTLTFAGSSLPATTKLALFVKKGEKPATSNKYRYILRFLVEFIRFYRTGVYYLVSKSAGELRSGFFDVI